jgi:rhodanese-related sulfurtransferase
MTTLSDATLPSIPEIDVHALTARMQAGGVVVIDVREDEEWEEMHVPGIPLLPMSEFELDAVPERAGKPLFILCRSGVRSLAVARRLVHRLGQTDVYNVTGGILAWQAAGYPIVSAARQEAAA